MRHRASRPLIDLWERLPRTVAERLGLTGDRRPVRVVASLVAALALVGGGGAVMTAMTGEPSRTTEADPPVVAAPPDTDAPESDVLAPETDGTSPAARSPKPSQPTAARPTEPSPTSQPSPSTTETPTDLLPLETRSATPSPRPVARSGSSPTNDDDVTSPITDLVPASPVPDGALLTFSANERATFACSLDGAAYTSCDSPVAYEELDPGWHTFAVRATDAAGNVDSSPAETRWHTTNANPEGADGQ